MTRTVTFTPPPWWNEFLDFICNLRPPKPPGPSEKTWQLGVSVFPYSATVYVQTGTTRVEGMQDGDGGHKLLKFTAPPAEENTRGTLVVEAPNHVTHRASIAIGPDQPEGYYPYWPELPAIALEMEAASWQLGISVDPADANAYVDACDHRSPGEVDGGHRLLKFSTPDFLPNAEGQLTVEKPGYTPVVQALGSIGPDKPPSGDCPNWPELPAVTLERAVEPLCHLRINGIWFEKDDGTPWLRLACTDFALLRLMHEGQDITPIVRERVTMGFNEARVFSMMCGNLGRLLPTEIPDYYTSLLSRFLDLCEAESLRIELTALVDANDGAHWSQQQRIDHFNQCAEILARRTGTPHLLERVNENDQGMNATSMDGFTCPTNGVWCCSGSYGADVIPPDYAPQWHYGTVHPARPPDWPRKAVHNPMEDIADRCKVPATANELTRPDQGRGPVASDHFDTGAGISLLHNGGCFHSETGKFSRSFATSDPDRQCATEYIRGAKLVPLSYRYGQYTAGHLSEMPIESHPTGGSDPLNWNSRAYARITANTSCAVVLQRTAEFQAKPLNGWTIVEQVDSVFFCTR